MSLKEAASALMIGGLFKMKSYKKTNSFEFHTDWYDKRKSSYIDHLKIHWLGKYKNRNIYYLIASVDGKKNDFEFSKDWNYKSDWTDQDIDVDEFAAITYVMNKIRKEYPYLYLIGQRNDPLPDFILDYIIKEFTTNKFPMIEIDTKYGPSFHEGIIERPNIITRLVELGKDGSFRNLQNLYGLIGVNLIYIFYSVKTCMI